MTMELDLWDAWLGECWVNADRCDMDRGFRVTKVTVFHKNTPFCRTMRHETAVLCHKGH